MGEPFPDVVQDLWQLIHVTTSYLARAFAGGILLATGIIDDNAVAIVVAALFLPFLPEVLAVSVVLRSRDRAWSSAGSPPSRAIPYVSRASRPRFPILRCPP